MAPDDTTRSYDRVAADYDERFGDELVGKPRDRELLAAFADAVADPVLEVGSGPGQIGVHVADHGRRVVPSDRSLPMADRARRRLGCGLVADLRALPVTSASVGGVLAFYSLIHLDRAELGGAVGELARVLRPGGRLLATAHEGSGLIVRTELLGHTLPFSATLLTLDELTAAATAAGLEVTLAERRPPYAGEGDTIRLAVEARRPT